MKLKVVAYLTSLPRELLMKLFCHEAVLEISVWKKKAHSSVKKTYIYLAHLYAVRACTIRLSII